MSAKPSLLAELKRRNVVRAAGLYLVGAWLVVQVGATLLPVFDAPAWLMKALLAVLAIGFAPVLIFAWVFELTPSGLKRDAEVPADESITPRTARSMDRAIIVMLVCALVYFAIDKFVLEPHAPSTVASDAKALQPPNSARNAQSIAVLPLSNDSGDKDQQYFSDGLSEDLINALAQFDGLKVIGRNSAFLFRNSTMDAKTIGEKLGVAHLLEGSVRRAGSDVRINAGLIKVDDSSVIWSQRYNRPYTDLFALQDEITQAVAGALRTKLLTDVAIAPQGDRPPSGDLGAYASYLQSRFFVGRHAEADLREAITEATNSIRLDSRYAQAHVVLANAWASLAAQYLGGDEAQRAYTQARAAINTALSLEPNLASAHSARGYILQIADFNWSGAEADYRKAAELAPNDASIMTRLGILSASLGHPDQAVVLTRRALTTDPLNSGAYTYLAYYLTGLGRLDEATAAVRKAIELQPAAPGNRTVEALIEIARGNAPAALVAAQAESTSGGAQDVALALARQIGSDQKAADAALQRLIDQQSDGAPYQIAEVYAARRDPDHMFEWLDRAWANRDAGIIFTLFDPLILRYQTDPRFAAFCQKAGLPATTTAK